MAAVSRAAGLYTRPAGLYARVSSADQRCEGQLEALRRYAAARGWEATEYVDHGVSGAKERRPALDAMLAAARRRDLDLIVVTKLDRLARSLHQLVATGRELEALGVDLVVVDQSIDTTTPSGRLLFHVLGAIAEFERDLLRERVVAGLRWAQTHGTRSGKPIGRPSSGSLDLEEAKRLRMAGLGYRKIGRRLGVSPMRVKRALVALTNPASSVPSISRDNGRVLPL